ncbi:MAG: PRC-barrel domain-containing protein [Chloroflexi bacterium]|nr:PRC-barrel domain-containing protein [Chloroflexota bacterium]
MAGTIRVVSRDGEFVGRLEHVVAEPGHGRPTGLVIARNGTTRLLPLSAVSSSDGSIVRLRGPASSYDELPLFNRPGYRVLDEELAVRMELDDEDFQIGEAEPNSAFDRESSSEMADEAVPDVH